jgi:hypothetical protein
VRLSEGLDPQAKDRDGAYLPRRISIQQLPSVPRHGCADHRPVRTSPHLLLTRVCASQRYDRVVKECACPHEQLAPLVTLMGSPSMRSGQLSLCASRTCEHVQRLLAYGRLR